MKKRIKFCLMIVVCIVLVILFPILMDIFILGNDIPSNISNSDWAGFIGSYVGGIATIVAVVITIWHTTKENNERMIQAGLENRENRRKSIKPFLETRCSYINEPTNMKENDRIFIFKDKMCCRVRSNFEQNDIDVMNTLSVPYMFCYKIINAGAGNAVNMLVMINGFAERLVVLQGETVNLYMLMDSPNVQLDIKLDYWDIESIGHYQQIDNISLQGENRGYAFKKGDILQIL